MATKIRLTRMGKKGKPSYRIVVSDSRGARDASYIDQIGFFDPLAKPEVIKVDVEKANKWLATGAQPTDTAKALLKKGGVEFKVKVKKEKKTKEVQAKAPKTASSKPAATKSTAAKKPATAAKKPAAK